MQFNRKWFQQPRDTSGGQDHYQDALANPDNIIWFLKKNGFVQRDGSDITQVHQNVRWKYDTDNKIYFEYKETSDWTRWWSLTWQYGFSQWDIRELMSNTISYSNIAHITEFFIPLKNKGFIFMNYHTLENAYGFTPTPPLHTIASFPDTGSTDKSVTNTTCIFNNVTNKYNYMYGNRAGNDSPWSYTWLSFHIADQIVDEHKLPLVEQGTGRGSWGSFGNYTDVKQNICTLIKYPYNNGFISNLFLITTAPRYGGSTTGASACGLDNKFFSFNGRNFYGVYSNLAVELPAN